MYSFVMSEFSGSECVGYLIHAGLNHYPGVNIHVMRSE
jgi:hypothetical protein